MTSAKEIKALRTRLGLTQVQFAQVLGVHPLTVSRWEREHGTPPDGAAAQLLKMLELRGRKRVEPDAMEPVLAALAANASVKALGLLVSAMLKGVK